MISIPIDNTSVNPAPELRHRGLRRLLGDRAAVGVHRLPDHRRDHRRGDLDVRDHRRRGLTRRGDRAVPRRQAARRTRDRSANSAGANPADRLGFGTKGESSDACWIGSSERSTTLHNRLWAEASRSVVLVLQGHGRLRQGRHHPARAQRPEPAGMRGRELQGADHATRSRTTTCGACTMQCPRRGILGVMNRSHYEDVVTAHVLGLIDDEQRARRYRHIREFERMLTDEGTTVVKVFLHISKEEQRARLQERIDDPRKNWKFRSSDLAARAQWDEYQRRLRARRSPRPRPSGRPGTSCRPTTSGSATSPSRRSSSTCSSGSTRRYPTRTGSRGASSSSNVGERLRLGRLVRAARHRPEWVSRWTSSRVIPSL